jgi:Electron transfer DM13
LSERVLEVRGFVYDGQAPAVYFWADTNAVPSTSGFRMNDGSPNNGCGVTPLPQQADGSVTYRVEFPDGTTILDLLGGSISLWCESFSVSFGEVIVPTSLSNIPDTASGPTLECSANVVETPIAAPSAPTIPAPTAEPVTPPSSVTVPAPTATTEAPATEAPAASPTAGTATTDAPVVSPVAVPTTTTVDVPYLLGNLTTRAHNVTGMVYIISDHIIEIRVSFVLLQVKLYREHLIMRLCLMTCSNQILIPRDLHTTAKAQPHTFIWTLRQYQRRMALAYLTV